MNQLAYEIRGNERHMAWQYQVIEECCYHVDLGDYPSYGIRVCGPEGEQIIHDIAPDRGRALYIAELFTRHQLSPIHFKEAVEDMIAIL